jgi:putative membrane protein
MNIQSKLCGAVALVLAIAAVSPAWAKTDNAFLADAIKGDNSEITLGNLAVQKASSQNVKAFGQTLIDDHTAAKRDAVSAAAKLKVTPSTDMTDEAKAEMTKLNALSGAAFDKEFVAYMVQDHQKDVSDFKDEEKTGGKTVAALAKKTLPTLEKHLNLAQSLSTKT